MQGLRKCTRDFSFHCPRLEVLIKALVVASQKPFYPKSRQDARKIQLCPSLDRKSKSILFFGDEAMDDVHTFSAAVSVEHLVKCTFLAYRGMEKVQPPRKEASVVWNSRVMQSSRPTKTEAARPSSLLRSSFALYPALTSSVLFVLVLTHSFCQHQVLESKTQRWQWGSPRESYLARTDISRVVTSVRGNMVSFSRLLT